MIVEIPVEFKPWFSEEAKDLIGALLQKSFRNRMQDPQDIK